MESREYSEDIDLQKYWLVLKRRWFPASFVFGTTVVLAALFTALQEPVYEAKAKLLIKPDRATSLTGLESQIGRGDVEVLSAKSEPLSTQAEIIKSLPVAQATVEALDLRAANGEFIDPQKIANGVSVKPLPGTDVLQISYQENDPELAAAVVNQVMAEYQQKNIFMNRAEAAAALEFINEQLPQTEAAVVEAEEKLRRFKEANGIIILEEESSAAVTTLSNLDREITQVQAELSEVSAQAAELRNQVGMGAQESVEMSSLSQSVGVQEALLKLQEVQSELAAERARYQDGHPTIATLLREEERLTNLVQQRVGQVLGRDQSVAVGNLQLGEIEQGLIADYVQTEVQRLGLVRRLNQLSNSQATFQARKSALPELEQTHRELERQLTASQTTYEALLTQLQEVEVSQNQVVGNAQVISEALVPAGAIAPNKKLGIAAGVVLGLILAIATAFLIDLIDKSVKTVREAKDLFDYPVLGIIPAFGNADSKRSHVTHEDLDNARVIVKHVPHSPVAAAYQMLQANLKFLKTDGPLQTIAITSSVPKEGKSEVAANLAAAIAQVGRRVLLIDADLRFPSQHHLWNITNTMGLSNIIVGQVAVEEVIQRAMPNLDVLTAGVIPPNPIALLDSRRMASLIQHFSQRYDFVILDTPALAGAADAPTVGKMVDGTLLVVRPGVVDATGAKTSREFLTRSNLKVLGLVANGVIAKNEPDSYFYYQGSTPSPTVAPSEESTIAEPRT
ncbi:MAG: GumC family protein [Elainellaceae cyanobacterium]